MGNSYEEVPLSAICSPAQRQRLVIDQAAVEELARSIRRVGLLQPLVVKRIPNGYEVVAGERRFLACQMLLMGTVMCQVRDGDDAEAAAVMLSENLQRLNLTPVEEAHALEARATVLGESVAEIAAWCAKSEPWVRARLGMLAWPPSLLEAVGEGRLSMAAARPLVEIEDAGERDRLIVCAVESGANAMVTTQWAASARGMAMVPPESMSAHRQSQVAMGAFVLRMPCFCCRVELPGLELRVVRMCPECCAGLQRGLAAGEEEAAASEVAAAASVVTSEDGSEVPPWGSGAQ